MCKFWSLCSKFWLTYYKIFISFKILIVLLKEKNFVYNLLNLCNLRCATKLTSVPKKKFFNELFKTQWRGYNHFFQMRFYKIINPSKWYFENHPETTIRFSKGVKLPARQCGASIFLLQKMLTQFSNSHFKKLN